MAKSNWQSKSSDSKKISEMAMISKMKKISQILKERQLKNLPKNLSKEFQVFGVYLAESLDDTKHYSLYIKLAKEYDRNILEQVLSFVKGSFNPKSKGRLFMWKLKQLKDVSTSRQVDSEAKT